MKTGGSVTDLPSTPSLPPSTPYPTWSLPGYWGFALLLKELLLCLLEWFSPSRPALSLLLGVMPLSTTYLLLDIYARWNTWSTKTDLSALRLIQLQAFSSAALSKSQYFHVSFYSSWVFSVSHHLTFHIILWYFTSLILCRKAFY